MNLSKPEYPYNQYVKDGKADLEKIAKDEKLINSHILTRLLLCAVLDLQKQIDNLPGDQSEQFNKRLNLNPENTPKTAQEVVFKEAAKPAKKPGRKKAHG